MRRHIPWDFAAVGHGAHETPWWRTFAAALERETRAAILSVEHEDRLVAPEDGVATSARLLAGLVDNRAAWSTPRAGRDNGPRRPAGDPRRCRLARRRLCLDGVQCRPRVGCGRGPDPTSRPRRDRPARLSAERPGAPPAAGPGNNNRRSSPATSATRSIAEMASLVEREVARFGFAAMLCATEGDDDREEQAIDLMLENRVSGLVFLSFLGRPAEIEKRINGQVPVVFVAAEEPWADSVTVDEHRGGELVARHLIELGHRRLAFVGPRQPDRADARRLEGFLRAAADARLRPTVDRAGIRPTEPSRLKGRPRTGRSDPRRSGRGDRHLRRQRLRRDRPARRGRFARAFGSRRTSRSSVSTTSTWPACVASA